MLPDILNQKFKKEEHKSEGYTMPEGSYSICLTKWVGVAKNGTVKVDLSFSVTHEGKYEGRKLKQFWFVEHPTKKAVEISYQKIASLAESAEIPDDSLSVMLDSLVGVDLFVELGIQKGNGGYADSNVIKFAYKPGIIPDKLVGAPEKEARPTPTPSSSESVKDDDVPF